jgi:kynurenine formamidase
MTMDKATAETVIQIAKQYCNWNRWGTDDELGTLNYITAAKVRSAAGLVKRGSVFSLAIPFDANGPQNGEVGRINPVHVMLQDGGDIALGAQESLDMQYTDDAVYMVLQCGTQWDALAHAFHEGHMYNGYGLEQVNSQGAMKNSIARLREQVVGRGVLLDVARYKGRSWLEPGEPIGTTDLEGCAAKQGVLVGEGDIVLVRTGQMARVREQGGWGDYTGGPAPGLAVSSAEFLCERHVAALATDTWTIEVWPREVEGVRAALHVILLVYAGMTLGEIFNLEELASDCAQDKVYDFLFVAPPLPITGAVGSPINPLAIK